MIVNLLPFTIIKKIDRYNIVSIYYYNKDFDTMALISYEKRKKKNVKHM